jgi:hypothetical protein
MRNFFTIALFALLVPLQALANDVPAYIAQHVPDAEKVGQGRMTYIVMDVYDAALYAPDGKIQADKPFALTLTYHHSFESRSIAYRSIAEMRRQGVSNEINLASWHERMLRIFPDVDRQSVLTGIANTDGSTAFYSNGKPIGVVRDPEFTRQFFNIWLGPKSSEPKLRQQLLGRTR